MNVEMLSRLQFAFTAAFHYLYPLLSIGLGLTLVMMAATWLRTRNPLYHNMARFWTKVFGQIFGLGVATGIVLEFEFGTNWATYSRFVGDIFGSALVASLLSLVTGHSSAGGVAENQPSKLAAMEGLWETGPQAPLHPFGWVDTAGGRTRGPKIPAGLSLLVEGKADHVVTGLNDIPPDLRPPLQVTFQCFHVIDDRIGNHHRLVEEKRTTNILNSLVRGTSPVTHTPGTTSVGLVTRCVPVSIQ